MVEEEIDVTNEQARVSVDPVFITYAAGRLRCRDADVRVDESGSARSCPGFGRNSGTCLARRGTLQPRVPRSRGVADVRCQE